jgi:invasion protein IalB
MTSIRAGERRIAATHWRIVLLGLAVAVVAQRADAQQSTAATYDDWTVHCSVVAGSPSQKSCDMEQLSYGQNKEQPFSRLAILRRENGKGVSLVVQVPVSVWLATAVRVEIGGKDVGAPTPFARCGPAGCFAEIGLTAEVQKQFRTAREPGRILYKNAAQQDVAVPMSFKGFGQAFDGLVKQTD